MIGQRTPGRLAQTVRPHVAEGDIFMLQGCVKLSRRYPKPNCNILHLYSRAPGGTSEADFFSITDVMDFCKSHNVGEILFYFAELPRRPVKTEKAEKHLKKLFRLIDEAAKERQKPYNQPAA